MTQTVKMVGFVSWAVPEQGWRKGPWTPEEDQLLSEYVTLHGEGRWSSVARCAGLNRSGKSCRLRWVNYLRPGLKRGQITPQEEGIITELHALWGNKWSTIARYLPGRTDNEIKNYWRTHFKKKGKSARKSSERRKSKNPKPLRPKTQELEAEKPQIERINSILPQPQISQHAANAQHQNNDQELTFMYLNTTMNEQDLPSPWIDATCHDQDGSWWDSLWDFDDQASTVSVGDQMQQDHYCSKMASSALNNGSTNYNINNDNNDIINNSNNNDNNIPTKNAFHLLGRGSKPFVQ